MRLLIQTATATGGAAAAALQSHSLQAQYNYSSMREDDIELAIKVVSQSPFHPPLYLLIIWSANHFGCAADKL